jgi:hypothetical protein
MKTPEYYDAVQNLAIKASKGEIKAHIFEEIIWDISQSFEIDNTETIVQDVMEAHALHYIETLKPKIKVISMGEWDCLVKQTYGKPYKFQQQQGCRYRGKFKLVVPAIDGDHRMHKSIPEVVNGKKMGVKFQAWLDRDPKQPLPPPDNQDYSLELFWWRNFYPHVGTLANDLHAKGLLEAGEYRIDIDW